jgi:hypothetical protein
MVPITAATSNRVSAWVTRRLHSASGATLFAGGQFLEREGGRPHAAFVVVKASRFPGVVQENGKSLNAFADYPAIIGRG